MAVARPPRPAYDGFLFSSSSSRAASRAASSSPIRPWAWFRLPPRRWRSSVSWRRWLSTAALSYPPRRTVGREALGAGVLGAAGGITRAGAGSRRAAGSSGGRTPARPRRPSRPAPAAGSAARPLDHGFAGQRLLDGRLGGLLTRRLAGPGDGWHHRSPLRERLGGGGRRQHLGALDVRGVLDAGLLGQIVLGVVVEDGQATVTHAAQSPRSAWARPPRLARRG